VETEKRTSCARAMDGRLDVACVREKVSAKVMPRAPMGRPPAGVNNEAWRTSICCECDKIGPLFDPPRFAI
jgi:hypothetical protein